MLHLRLGGAVATRLCTVAPPAAVATAAATTTTTTAWLQLWQQPQQRQQHPSCSSARIHTTCATAAPRRLVKGSVLPKRGRKIIGEGKHRRSGTAWLQGSGSRASSGEEGLGFVRSYQARNSRPRRVAMAAMPRPKGETDVDESFVNDGYYNWVKQRSEWQGDSNEPKKRIRVVKVNTLALIDAVRNMKRVVKLTRPVPLPQMVDILVEVWETDGLQ